MRNRQAEWMNFCCEMQKHIEHYANKQYGNPEGDEQVDKWTPAQCVDAIYKYCVRFGKGARGFDEQLRDLLKIAHFAQFAFDKLKAELNVVTLYCDPVTDFGVESEPGQVYPLLNLTKGKIE